ncbi:MAG: hypothetical protein NT091_02145, partial [Candidatus Falkowbacteria bacterium]|nr:hypothetical protein [Candidatus Falkowbacteria bacterium]
DPVTGKVGYCSIMGANKEFYGLGIHKGSEGLNALDKIAKGEHLSDNMAAVTIQNCIMVSFDSRSYIEPEEMDIIKKTGVTFDNRNFWPQFKDYTPGYYPWLITKEQVDFLIIAIEQATIVCTEHKDVHIPFAAMREEWKFLVRIPSKKGYTVSWKDKISTPANHDETLRISVINEKNELSARNIKKTINSRSNVAWEIDFFYLPEPVRDNAQERPYFSYLFLIVDSSCGVILKLDMSPPFKNYANEFRRAFLDAVIENGFYPEKIYLKNEATYNILEPIAKILKIKIERHKNLKMLDEARDDLSKSFKVKNILKK